MIAKQANLINVNWNGYLKRERLSDKFLAERQKVCVCVCVCVCVIQYFSMPFSLYWQSFLYIITFNTGVCG